MRTPAARTPFAGSASRLHPGGSMPRLPLFAAIGLIGFAIAATMFGRATEIGTLRVPTTAPQAIRDLTFVTDSDEVLTVRDARSGDVVAVYQPEEGGFVRGSQRGIGRDRKLLGIAADEPYRLILWDDGRLTISDTKTGQRFPLDAFGPTNSAAFARLLDDRRNTR